MRRTIVEVDAPLNEATIHNEAKESVSLRTVLDRIDELEQRAILLQHIYTALSVFEEHYVPGMGPELMISRLGRVEPAKCSVLFRLMGEVSRARTQALELIEAIGQTKVHAELPTLPPLVEAEVGSGEQPPPELMEGYGTVRNPRFEKPGRRGVGV